MPPFFFNDTATTEIYTLSLHDALPIWRPRPNGSACTRTARSRDFSNGTQSPGHRGDRGRPAGDRPLQPGGGGGRDGVYGGADCPRPKDRRGFWGEHTRGGPGRDPKTTGPTPRGGGPGRGGGGNP